MKKFLVFLLICSVLYLAYKYWLKYQSADDDNLDIIPIINKKKSKKKIVKKKSVNNKHNYIDQSIVINSDDNYQLTEGALNDIDNVFQNHMQSKNRTHVFMDITIHDEYIGRIIIELFDDIVPYTVKNFIYMCENHYKNSIFHRIIDDFVIQGGDYINRDGTGSNSIYGKSFKDENFNLKHDSKYLLSMANSGPNTNGCQFFITLNELPHLDNKHVVFGKIINNESFELVDKLANVLKNKDDKPIVDCVISDCGIL
jgi:peptidyl-prolyl isomerase H (cyclophilin H)